MIEPDLHPPDPPEEPVDPDLLDDAPPDPSEPSEEEYERGAWLAEAALWDRIRGRD